MNLVAAGYSYWLNNFLEGVYTEAGLFQIQNRGKVHASGVENRNQRPAVLLARNHRQLCLPEVDGL